MLVTPETPGPLCTIHDVSQDLGVAVATLYRWRTQNYGPRGMKVGRSYLIAPMLWSRGGLRHRRRVLDRSPGISPLREDRPGAPGHAHARQHGSRYGRPSPLSGHRRSVVAVVRLAAVMSQAGVDWRSGQAGSCLTDLGARCQFPHRLAGMGRESSATRNCCSYTRLASATAFAPILAIGMTSVTSGSWSGPYPTILPVSSHGNRSCSSPSWSYLHTRRATHCLAGRVHQGSGAIVVTERPGISWSAS